MRPEATTCPAPALATKISLVEAGPASEAMREPHDKRTADGKDYDQSKGYVPTTGARRRQGADRRQYDYVAASIHTQAGAATRLRFYVSEWLGFIGELHKNMSPLFRGNLR
jgi:hypothetical protein